MEYFIADPAGNITAFVLGKVDARIAAALLAQPGSVVEQVAFLSQPERGGHIKCDMAGGEFCGNACRAAGFYYALTHDLPEGAEVAVEMSGCGAQPVSVTAYPRQGRSFVSMPLPKYFAEAELAGRSLPLVAFDGISHIIAPYELAESIELTKELLHGLSEQLDAAALGVMFLDGDSKRLKPVVWVDQVGSLVWESSCGSGTCACAWWLSRHMRSGTREFLFQEPGGTLEVWLKRNEAGESELQLGGEVRLPDHPRSRTIEL